jgi:hypothetical protein
MSVVDKKGWVHTNSRKNVFSKRDFYGSEFYVYCLKQYEEARVFLKRGIRPTDEFDRLLIEEAKFASKYFKALITDEDATKLKSGEQ